MMMMTTTTTTTTWQNNVVVDDDDDGNRQKIESGERERIYVSYLQYVFKAETRGKYRYSIVAFFPNVGIISIDMGEFFLLLLLLCYGGLQTNILLPYQITSMICTAVQRQRLQAKRIATEKETILSIDINNDVEKRMLKRERNEDDGLVLEKRETRTKRKENCRLQSIFAACARTLRVFCYYY